MQHTLLLIKNLNYYFIIVINKQLKYKNMAISTIMSTCITKQHFPEVDSDGRIYVTESMTKPQIVPLCGGIFLDLVTSIALIVVGVLAIMHIVPLNPAATYSLLTAGGINAGLMFFETIKGCKPKYLRKS